MHHFSRKYCIMTSLYHRCHVFDVILNGKGRNSVEENAIVHDNSDLALLRPQAPLLQSTDVVNQWISKDLSCDALMHIKNPYVTYSCLRQQNRYLSIIIVCEYFSFIWSFTWLNFSSESNSYHKRSLSMSFGC